MQHVKPLPLEEYRSRVGTNLDLILGGASMTIRHVNMLDRRPMFDTKAQCELDHAEAVLEKALEKIRAAKAAYDSKPVELSYAS